MKKEINHHQVYIEILFWVLSYPLRLYGRNGIPTCVYGCFLLLFISKKLGPNDYAGDSGVTTFFFPSNNLFDSLHISGCLRFNLKILIHRMFVSPRIQAYGFMFDLDFFVLFWTCWIPFSVRVLWVVNIRKIQIGFNNKEHLLTKVTEKVQSESYNQVWSEWRATSLFSSSPSSLGCQFQPWNGRKSLFSHSLSGGGKLEPKGQAFFTSFYKGNYTGSPSHSFTCCLWLLSCCKSRVK